jgi:hypothetical protein
MTAVCPRVAALPRCPVRGLPIPVSSGRDTGTGAARFGRNDPAAKLACALGELCGICGDPLAGEPMVFFAVDTFPPDVDPGRLLFPDPPNHAGCLADAMGLCPFITAQRMPRRARPADGKDGWLMLTCGGYELRPGRPPAVLFTFKPRRIETVRRFSYSADGALTEEDT